MPRTIGRVKTITDSGLCCMCGREPRCKSMARCAKCKKKWNAWVLENKRRRAALGMCVQSGCKLPPLPGMRRCELHRVIENTQQKERRRLKQGKPMIAVEPISLDQAKFMALGGKLFGDIYPILHHDDRQTFKEWYLREPAVGIQRKPSPTQEILDSRDLGYTGDICTNCQGSRMKRSGACQVCEDCGEPGGCS